MLLKLNETIQFIWLVTTKPCFLHKVSLEGIKKIQFQVYDPSNKREEPSYKHERIISGHTEKSEVRT